MAEELLSMEKEVEGASNEGLRTVEGEVQLLAVGQDVGAGQEKMVEKDFQKMSLGYSARETEKGAMDQRCLLYTSPSPRDPKTSRMPSSA